MRFLAATLLLAACATTPAPTLTTPNGGPRGLRASDHLDVARQHDEQARQRSAWPESQIMVAGNPDLVGRPVVMPWYRSWDTQAEQERLAQIHRSKAAELHDTYEVACRDLPRDAVERSPFERFGLGGWPSASGAIVYLSPAGGTPDQFLAAMKCHRAYMMLAPAGMEDCPLDLPGLVIDARGDADGVTVSLSIKDSKLVPELQRRTVHDLEAAQRGTSATTLHEHD